MAQKLKNSELQQRFSEKCVKSLKKLPLRPCRHYQECPFGLNSEINRNCFFFYVQRNTDKDGHMPELAPEDIAKIMDLELYEVEAELEAGQKVVADSLTAAGIEVENMHLFQNC